MSPDEHPGRSSARGQRAIAAVMTRACRRKTGDSAVGGRDLLQHKRWLCSIKPVASGTASGLLVSFYSDASALSAMGRIEKTVFISYRRTNVSWALAVFQNLTHHGYDVFLDYSGVASGDFERVIFGNIDARAHFLVLLTPSALDRCNEPSDWLRREIEHAITTQRNVVPLLLEGFEFSKPEITGKLTGLLATLRRYNALEVYAAYFTEAMLRLREAFLNVPLDAVLQPMSPLTQQTAKDQQAAAKTAKVIQEKELTALEVFQRGFKAVKSQKDDAQAVSWYRQAADAGDAASMNNLGRMYEHGCGGLPKDDAQAVSWYRQAADAGDAAGMNNLGRMYEHGCGGLPKDDAQAVSWYRKAADAGDAAGMNNLGRMYERGCGGLPKDDAQAVSWYRNAAYAGDAAGMSCLGWMYEHGRGGFPKKDDAQAVNWYRKAAYAGDAAGMTNLGWMYEHGRGDLPKDDAQAVSWYRKAADAGDAAGMSCLGWMYEHGRGGLAQG